MKNFSVGETPCVDVVGEDVESVVAGSEVEESKAYGGEAEDEWGDYRVGESLKMLD